MDNGQIILFQTQCGKTKIKPTPSMTNSATAAQYQLSPVEPHFLEAFEAERKRLNGKR